MKKDKKAVALDDEQLESVVGGVDCISAAIDRGINSHKDNPLSAVNNPLSSVDNPLSSVNNPLSSVDNRLGAVNNPLSSVDNPSDTVVHDPNSFKNFV